MNQLKLREEWIARLFVERRGHGIGASYMPGNKVTNLRRLLKSYAPRGHDTHREHDLQSTLEHDLFMFLEWNNRESDIKEQFYGKKYGQK